MKNTFVRLIAVAVAACAAACVHKTEEPPLFGPSTFATSLRLLAVPDRINQDGASQSSITVQAFGPTGAALSGVALRMDMLFQGELADFGALSARTVVTGNDGTARVVYTAPPPLPSSISTSTTVSIRAIPIGTDASTSNGQTVDIRLMPTGVILPPSGAPTASFTFGPQPVSVGVPVIFDGSTSQPGQNSAQITTYAWNFGDGQTGSGQSPTHTFQSTGTFNVTLTVTNDRGLQASTGQPVAVGSSDPFTGDWVISPLNPVINVPILFNADAVQTSPGHQVTTFNWTFGDGTGGTGFQTQHTYTVAGTYNVILSVTDDLGRKKVFAPKAITVGTGGPTVVIAFLPTAPAMPAPPAAQQVTVTFNSNGTTTSNGATIVSYQWDFGDSTPTSGAANPAHVYTSKGTFSVTLTVTDSFGRVGKGTATVTVS
jgi:PKD repeat protein